MSIFIRSTDSAMRPYYSLSAMLLVVAGLCAEDAISIIPVTTTANEQRLVPAEVIFQRTGSGLPLTVLWRISGSARSDLHGGQVRSIYVADGGQEYRRSAAPVIITSAVVPTRSAAGTGFSLGGRVSSINLTSGGTRYESTSPNVVIDDSEGFGASWTPAMAPYNEAVSGSIVTYYRVGNYSPNQLINGQGYVNPTVSINLPTDPTGTRAFATAVVSGSPMSAVEVNDEGYGYPMPTITISGGGGSGAVASAVVKDGKIVSIAVGDGGTGYTSSPTVTINANGSGGSGCSATAIVSGGSVQRVDVLLANQGSGYGPTAGVDDGYATTLADLDLVMAGADYMVSAVSGVAVTGVDSNGDLIGTITFADNELFKTLQLRPVRNGVGGARQAVVQIDPSPTSAYIVNAQSSGPISIADADVQATISVPRPLATPTLSNVVGNEPIEIQGRGEWHVALNDNTLQRSVAVEVRGDAAVGPLAVPDSEYLLAYNTVPLPQTGFVYTPVVRQNATATDGPPGPGVSTVYVESLEIFTGNDIVFFENPSVVTNGIYTVTGFVAATATDAPAIIISPAIKQIQTSFGNTRVRRVARLIPTVDRFTLFGQISDLYYYAFPVVDSAPSRARRSINLTMVQSDDYRTLSPTSGTVTLADDAVTVNVRLGNNAAKPNTSGVVDVLLTGSFPSGVNVPFRVINGSTATYGVDYTIDGVNATTLIGSVQVNAGQTSARIIVNPITNADVAPENVVVQLLASPDYLLAPSGTSGVNPTATVTIAPRPLTNNGNPVYLAVTSATVIESGTLATLTVRVTDQFGVASADLLATSAAVSYVVSGSATTGSDYNALAGSLSLNAGVNSGTIVVPIIQDDVVEGDETVIVTLSNGAGYQVSSNSIGTVTIQDDEPRVSVVANVPGPTEGGATSGFTITSSVPVTRAAGLNITYTISGSATPGTDYSTLSGTVTIPQNNTTASISVSASADAELDPGETVVVTINPDTASNVTYSVGGAPFATLTIVDTTPGISITAASDLGEGGSAGGVVITSTLAVPSALTVRYVVSGSATAGSDYATLSGTAVIPANGTTVTIPVQGLADSIADPNETVIITLSDDTTNPPAYVISGVSTATLTVSETPIDNTDPPKNTASGGSASGGCGAGGAGVLLLGGLAFLSLRRRRAA